MKSYPPHQAHSPLVILLLATFLQSGVALGMEHERDLVWGTNSVVLPPPWSGSPSLGGLLADQEHTVALNRFYRVGGVRAATPTECRLAYNSNALYVVFRCQEHDLSFPATNREMGWYTLYTRRGPQRGIDFSGTNQVSDWYSLLGSPGGTDSWPPFPDEVDFFVQPDTASPSCYQFAVTPNGSKYACQRLLSSNLDDPDRGVRGGQVDAFEASVTKGTNEWTVFLQIPWKSVGGMPQTRFGFLPLRTRWRDGEYSSPVAIDFSEWLPVDLFIEAGLAGGPAAQSYQTSLCRLPSGILRWQRPAIISHADADTLQQIWQMETSLSTPTDMSNLGQRLYLTQRWMDTMMLEGFTPLPRAWGELTNDLPFWTKDLSLRLLRQSINAALRRNDTVQACQLLDSYLAQFDQMSRWWYADGSPGDLLKQEWTPVASVESLEVKNKVALMRCQAGSHQVDLHLALPKTGGVRIYGHDEGYWKPADLLPLKVVYSQGRRPARGKPGERVPSSSAYSIPTAAGGMVISPSPFTISFEDAAGNEVTRLGANDLAFRFGADGRIIATDFRNQLDPGEVIYGFGEKYDRFNQNGNVLTLWETDDWVGNGMGLRDTTYKLVPVIHSSKGYMIFDNSSYRLRADVGVASPDQYRLTQPGPIFDYYVWTGTPAAGLESYTALTGRPILPPKWAFEEWMGMGSQVWSRPPLHNAVAQEESDLKQFEALDIPHSAIYAEGQSQNSPALNRFMAAHGIKVLGGLSPAQAGLAPSLLPDLKADQLPILNGGSPAATRAINYVDFTRPNALDFTRRWWQPGLDAGVAGAMLDMGDMVPDGAVFYNGKRGDEMHNFYTYDYHRTMSEVFQERRGNDFILFGRAATPGAQKWVGNFAGDHSSNFDGLKAVLTGALNLCACGFSTWGSDLGGYFGLPEPAVYIRWTQFGLFSPLMRWHGKAPREPWYFGEVAVANYKYDAWVRENLLNYIYHGAVVAHQSGLPIMRSLAVAFPAQPSLAAIRDEYMFGDDLLVAPVLNEDNYRTISFPAGVWTGLWDGKTVTGPAAVKTGVPLDVIPVYLRPGAVMPVQLNRELQFGASMTRLGRPLDVAPMLNRVNVLVVTPPNEYETLSLLNAGGEAAKVTVQSTAAGFDWKLVNLPEMDYLLVYGATTAATVKVDGQVMPKVTTPALGFGSLPAGWQADPAGNRLVIRLPPAQARQNRAKEIEVDFNPAMR